MNLAVGCTADTESAAPTHVELPDSAVVLATVERDGSKVHIVETSPGAVVFIEVGPAQHAEATALVGEQRFRIALSSGLVATYTYLADVEPSAELRRSLAEAQARLEELQSSVAAPEPPTSGARGLTVEKAYGSYGPDDWPYDESTYWSAFCPSGTFDDTHCAVQNAQLMDSGWSASTSYFRSTIWNSNGSFGHYNNHKLYHWISGSWQVVASANGSDPNEYTLMYSTYQYAKSTNVNGYSDGSWPDVKVTLVWDFL